MFFLKSSLKSVHLRGCKDTSELSTQKMPLPDEVIFQVFKDIRKDYDLKIKINDYVYVGQVIADSDNYFNSPIHSSVSGTVVNITDGISFVGFKIKNIYIKLDKEQKNYDLIKPSIKDIDCNKFSEIVRNSGLIGLGGAGFPTHIKLSEKAKEKVDLLIINAAECEPYITSDYRTIIEDSDNVIAGIKIIMNQFSIEKCYIGIESNKPIAINKLKTLLINEKNIELRVLKSRYPKGAEKVLIFELTGKIINETQIPLDLGCLVLNVSTVSNLNEYLNIGMPLIKRKITVSGDCIESPKNVEALIGTKVSDIVNFCGGFKKDPEKIIMGGPMMGITISDVNQPIIKNNNSILIFSKDTERDSYPCIRCGRCYRHCPMNLMPVDIEKAYLNRDISLLSSLKANICIECGCCSYVCPSKRNLTFNIKLSKKLLIQNKDR